MDTEYKDLAFEFLQELHEEMLDGLLNEGTEVQALINEEGAVIDWYYNDDMMINLLDSDEADIEENDFNKRAGMKAQYLKDKPSLKSFILRDLFFYIEMWILGNPTIKELRESVGLTRQQLANILLIPYATLEKWESEVRQPPTYVRRMINKEILSLQQIK